MCTPYKAETEEGRKEGGRRKEEREGGGREGGKERGRRKGGGQEGREGGREGHREERDTLNTRRQPKPQRKINGTIAGSAPKKIDRILAN